MMESTVNGEDNGSRREHCPDGNGDETSEVEVINWQQLEDELFAGKSTSIHQSRLSDTLNLREEIRRQLASDDAKNGLGMRKSKSGFLQTSSSSEDDDDGELNIEPASENESTSTEEVDNDKEFYLNHEFTTKVALHKVDPASKFRRFSKDSRYEATGYVNVNGKISPHRPADQLVIRPLQNRPSLKTRIQNNKDLQICFLNDLPVKNRPNSSSSGRSSTESTDKLLTSNKVMKSAQGPPILGNNFWSPPDGFGASKHSMGSFTMPKSQSMFEMESQKQRSDKFIMGQFEEVQAQWRQKMQSKIQIAHQQIHLQSQRQRRRQKKTPITSKIKLPHGKSRLDRAFLGDMNVSHLQVTTNDLLEQIESLNDRLVRFLEERDELHMEQDSKLVDIDDLSRRLKEQWLMNWRKKTLAFQAANSHKSFEEDAEFLYRNEINDRPAALAYVDATKNNDPTTSSSSAASSSDTSPTLAAMSSASLKNFRQKIKSLLS
ncbi:hypothetical protein RvY_16426 [Ramazzottius varieornatus]|uniref:Schwannomin interacting protein 1 C-terminal domain-containing protein n=1 Tax=Ramazzottius varieornatus TaxID=947166 RepID=A0A1D1VZ96_RAMVA|nr:hypothetical protein RvY_16426 [Ramazzottius varieornatus]